MPTELDSETFSEQAEDGQGSRVDVSQNRFHWFGFHPISLPLMGRLAYHRELISASLLPVMLSGLQAGTMSIVVKKLFTDAAGVGSYELNMAVGFVAGSRAIGHLTSFLWANASRGRPKILFIRALQLATAAVIAAIAVVPRTSAGLWLVTSLCILGWVLWSGVITLRAGVWRANYHHSYRARVAGKLSTVRALIIAAVGMLIGYSLDVDASSYHWLFPSLAVAGVLGAWAYGRVPFRQQRRHLASERASESADAHPLNPRMFFEILKQDALYRHYLVCMFLMGLGNHMLPPVLAIVLADQFQVGYKTGIALTSVIPLLCMTLVIPHWSRLLQRSHVIDFRALHVWVFAAVALCCVVGVVTGQIFLFFVAAVAQGVGWGGGVLAWNLGHQYFAPRAQDAEYMSVHITLVGIRGAFGPLLAVQLYGMLAPHGLQAGVFAICFLLVLLGGTGFVLLAKHRRLELAKSSP